MLDLATILSTETEVVVDPNQPIGWLAGIFTFFFCVAVALLLWSFTRVNKRARKLWEQEEQDKAQKTATDPEQKPSN